MPLPKELNQRCYQLLIRFDHFDSHQSLKSIFKAAELKAYEYDLPEASSRRDRVNKVIAFLVDTHSSRGAVFVLFLNELSSQVPREDERYKELRELIPLVAMALSNKDHELVGSHVPLEPSAPLAQGRTEAHTTYSATDVPANIRLFLSYGRQDYEQVNTIYLKLKEAGLDPWMDKKDIFGGETFGAATIRAIKSADFFLYFLSSHSANRRGFLQRELKVALDQWQERRPDDIYIIPVRLEACDAPEELSRFQWINMFEDDGWTSLTGAIYEGCRRLGRT